MSVSILSWYGVECPEDAIEDSLERFTEETGFFPLTFNSEAGTCPVGMFISMLFAEDIVSIEDLTLRAVIVVLKFVGEKMDLFAIFPIGTTIQDGGKRKRSDDYTIYHHHY